MADDRAPHALTAEEEAIAISLTRTIEGMFSNMPPNVVGEVIGRLNAQHPAARR